MNIKNTFTCSCGTDISCILIHDSKKKSFLIGNCPYCNIRYELKGYISDNVQIKIVVSEDVHYE